MTGLRSSAVLNVVHVTGRPPKLNNNYVSAAREWQRGNYERQQRDLRFSCSHAVPQDFRSATDFFTTHYVMPDKAPAVKKIAPPPTLMSQPAYPDNADYNERCALDEEHEASLVAAEVSEQKGLAVAEDALDSYVVYPDQSLRDYPLKGTNMFHSTVAQTKDTEGKVIRTGARVCVSRVGVCVVVLHGSRLKACESLLYRADSSSSQARRGWRFCRSSSRCSPCKANWCSTQPWGPVRLWRRASRPVAAFLALRRTSKRIR
jgi:hypothetical protein